MDFTKSVYLWEKKPNFFAVLAMSALQQLRVQSDLLDRTAFKALSLVVCAKDSMYKKLVDTLLHPSTSWG